MHSVHSDGTRLIAHTQGTPPEGSTMAIILIEEVLMGLEAVLKP
jgi:hypothetical protein